ncbi:MAG: type II secretion system protein [Cellvibrionaceae bacterium]
MNRQRGFTYLELVAVVVIIGILAASGLVYYERALDDARRVGVELLASRFAAATALMRAQWIVEGGRQGNGGKSVEVDNLTIFLNEFGWPANTDGGSPRSTDQTAEECYQVWQMVLQNPALATVEGRVEATVDGAARNNPEAKGRQRYHVSQIDNQACRYELLTNSDGMHFFDYNLRTGRVLVTVPPLD